MTDQTDLIPPLDYSDKAVVDALSVLDVDACAIVDYLAAHTSLRTAAEEYGIDCGLGELASTDPGIAWNHVATAHANEPALLERADERLHEHDTSYIESFDQYLCALARTMIELRGEDEVYAAAIELSKALDNGTLQSVAETT